MNVFWFNVLSVEDISSIAKSPNIKEISIDGNPVFLSGDCVSFLVSYLPHLVKLNNMLITDQVILIGEFKCKIWLTFFCLTGSQSCNGVEKKQGKH